MDPNCLEYFGIEPVKKVNKIIEKVKQNQKETYKNTFLDFLYIYKIYYPKNLYTISNNDTLLKIQMIDRKEEEFIKIKNNYFIYNNKVFLLSQYGYIIYFFRNNFIILNQNFEVISINSSDFDGIPIHKNNISPIPSINIPKKILESYGVQKKSLNNISLFFNIFNEKFFIRFWNTNLYIDNDYFFIYGGNEKYFFNKELEYIIPNIKIKQEEKIKNEKTLLDFCPEYPNINKDNDWKINLAQENYLISLEYKDIPEIQESLPFKVDDIIFSYSLESDNIIVSHNKIRLFTIGKNFSVTYRQTQDNMFSISNYDDLYFSDTLLKFLNFIKHPDDEHIYIYYNILLDCFFIEIFNFNLYIQSNKSEPFYYFVIYNNMYIFNHKLIYIGKEKFDYKKITIINDKQSMGNYGRSLGGNSNTNLKKGKSFFSILSPHKRSSKKSDPTNPLSPSSSSDSTASLSHLSPLHLKKVHSDSNMSHISQLSLSPNRLSSSSPKISSSSPKKILDTITEGEMETSTYSINK